MCLHDLSYPLCYHFTDTAMVVWQSPTSVTVSLFREAVTLYCVASSHGKCTYHWKKFGRGKSTFPSSPVIYINEGGLYQCIIKTGEEKEISSRVIRVYANIGKLYCSCVIQSTANP